MKRIAMTCLVWILAATSWAEEAEDLLRKGLFEEEGNQNLERAKESYLQLAELYDQQRRYAATALFRLGEIARKEGDAEEAAKWYRRVLGEFPENEALARLSRQNLAGLGMEAGETETEVAATEAPDEEAAELARLKELMQSSPDLIDGTDENGWRPIHYAAARNWSRVTRFLLDEGADVNGRTVQPAWTPLHVAVGHGHLEIVRMLLEAGAALEAEIDLSQWGGPNWREMPLSPLSYVTGNWRPLHLAVLWRRLEVAKALLAAGCERDPTGANLSPNHRQAVTPLMVALVNSHREMAETLLEAGADPKVSLDETGRTAVTVAMEHAPEMLPMLLEKGADPNHLHFAVYIHPESVPLLIAAGADVNRANEHGSIPLHYALDVATAKALLDAGANLEARDRTGETPLFHAARSDGGRAELVAFLLERGADPDAKRFDGRGLLELARNWAVPVVYERLVYPGASQPDAIVLFDHYDADGQARPQRADALPPGKERAQVAALRREDGFRPPGLAELLLINQVRDAYSLRVLRRDKEGRLAECFALSQPDLQEQRRALPPLQWGDVVEVLADVQGKPDGVRPAPVTLWWNSLPAREVTLKAGPWSQRVKIDPAATPASDDISSHGPWEMLDLEHLARTCGFVIDSAAAVTVRRGEVAVSIEVAGKAEERVPFIVQDGDVVEFALREEILSGGAERWSGVRIFNAGTMDGSPQWRGSYPDAVRNSRHLLDLFGLWVQYGNEDAFLAGADLSSVTVQRPEAGGMRRIEVDVERLARELAPGGAIAGSVAARDIELKDGDLIVVTPKGEVVTLGKPSERLDPAVAALLQAAAKERYALGRDSK